MQTQRCNSPTIEVICSGSAREMGFAQGAELRSKILASRKILSELEAFRLQRPWWLPYSTYRWLAERRASRYLSDALKQHSPNMSQRLSGIAEGAKLPLATVCLFNAMEPLLSSIGGCTACPSACSAVAVRGRRSKTGEPILVRNFDYLPLVQPFYTLRDSRPADLLRSLEFTTAPLAGAVDGMNHKGLCITYDYAFTADASDVPAAPISMLISEALERCETVAEAAAWIGGRPRCGGGLLMLADTTGDIASLELSQTRSHLRRPESGQDVLFHTNAFSSEVMQAVEAPRNLVYTERAPAPLRGRRLHLSSELRGGRFQQLLANETAFDEVSLGALMADHGSNGIADDFTPCVHGSYWYTTACLQLFPRSRRMRVAYASACEAQYAEFAL